MAPRLILILFAIAFGAAVIGAAVTTLREIGRTASAPDTRSSPAINRGAGRAFMDPRYG